MRALDLLRRFGGGAAGISASKMRSGANMGRYVYYSRYAGPANLLKGLASDGFLPPDQSEGNVPVDSDGWPTQDFSAGYQVAEIRAPYTITCQFTGQAAVAFSSQSAASDLSGVSYNSGTNTSTFTFTHDPAGNDVGAVFAFTNTKRSAVSSGNTGVTGIYFWRPEDVGDTDSIFTQAAVDFYSDFSVVRMMDQQDINNDFYTTTWSSRRRGPTLLGIEDLVKVSNQCGFDLWVQIPFGATDDWITNFFIYCNENLENRVHFGFSNECWNFAFYAYQAMEIAAFTELRGAVATRTAGRGIISAVRASNVTTVTLTYPNDLAVGEHIRTESWGPGNATVLSTPTSTSFTFSDPGADQTYSLTGTSYVFYSLDTGSTLLGTGRYANSDFLRYGYRRLVQASDICRSVVGDAAMMTKYRPMIEYQGGAGDGSYEVGYVEFLAGLQGKHAVDKIYAFAGAPYFRPDSVQCFGSSCPLVTPQQFADSYRDTMYGLKHAYGMGGKLWTAMAYGIKHATYEGGRDGAYDQGVQNNVNKNIATFVPQSFGDGHLQFLKDLSKFGFDTYMHYSHGVETGGLNSANEFVWSLTYDANVVTPYWRSFKDFNALPLSAIESLNLIEATPGFQTAIDGKWSVSNENGDDIIVGLGYPEQNQARYFVTVPEAGIWDLVITYAAFYGPSHFSVEVNGVVTASGITLTPNNTAGEYTNSDDLAPVPVTLLKGTNRLRLVAAENHGAGNNEQFKTLTFTRSS